MATRPGAEPEGTIVDGLRRHLQRMASLALSGEIEIHVTHGRAQYIKPPRMPLTDQAIDYHTLSNEQRAIIGKVELLLAGLAGRNASGQVWVIVRDGKPLEQLEQQFLDYLPQAS